MKPTCAATCRAPSTRTCITTSRGRRRRRSGRHPLPDPQVFAARLRRWGVDDDSLLLAYDDATGMWASRFWWMTAKWLGHRHVAVMDGGMRRWLQLGLPTTTDPAPLRPAGDFAARPDAGAYVDADTTQAAALDPQRRVLDARAAERYRGEVEPIDPVAGHVPGALNHPSSGVVAADGRFLPPAAAGQRILAHARVRQLRPTRSRCAGRASRPATCCWRWNTPDCPERASTPAAGASGRGTLRARSRAEGVRG